MHPRAGASSAPIWRAWSCVGLAHYLHPIDGGKYARAVLEGDPHWATVQAMGLASATRDKHNQLHTIVREDIAKTFAYATIYGAHDMRAGTIVYEGLLNVQRQCGAEGDALYREFFGMGTLGTQRIRKVGRKAREAFSGAIDGFSELQKKIEAGRELGPCPRARRAPHADPSSHSALNFLIQGAGAVLCKRWVADAFEECAGASLRLGRGLRLRAVHP
jgi:DNA polymerase-1